MNYTIDRLATACPASSGCPAVDEITFLVSNIRVGSKVISDGAVVSLTSKGICLTRICVHWRGCAAESELALSANPRPDHFFGIEHVADSHELVRIHFELIPILARGEEIQFAIVKGSVFDDTLHGSVRIPQ